MRGGIGLERGRPPVREEAKAPAGLWLARGGQPPGMSNKTADADRCFIPSHQAWDFLRGGIDAFSDFAPAPILKGAYRKRQQGGEKPSPSRLRRATSPERERLWQRRKVCSLTAGFFLPLTNEDETYPLCQGLALRESCRRRRLRGFFPEAHLSTIITLTKHKVAEEMFSFARQKRTRKAPATFDAREARPGFHPGPKSGGRRNKIGRCACGTDAFSDFAPAPILKGAY